MAKSKKIKLGCVMSEKRKDGSMNVYIALGTKSTNKPQYNTTVEILIKDADGNVVHKQTDGFIAVEDPRRRPEELLAANIISEETANKMRENVARIPAKLKHELFVKTVE